MRLRLGSGAKGAVLVSRLHPKDQIAKAYPNSTKDDRASGLIVVEEAVRKIRREEKRVVVFQHPARGDFAEPFECWAIHRFVHVTEEGNPEGIFANEQEAGIHQSGSTATSSSTASTAATTQEQTSNTGQSNGEREDNGHEIPNEIQDLIDASGGRNLSVDDTAVVRNMVPDMIDDDNQPAPENVPLPNENTDGIFSAWEHSGSCYRSMEGGRKLPARLNFPSSATPTLFVVWEMFFFTSFVKEVIIVETNKRLANLGQRSMSYGEFLRWIGVWLLMSTIHGPDRNSFWSLGEINRFKGAPWRLNDIMSRKRFDAILRAIYYTNNAPPPYSDRFWEVRQMLEMWNKNMEQQFTPSWVNCLDESMSVWTNKYTCPGWMFVPRKPHPFGNEYHTVCCSLSGILWGLELVEGKDAPQQRPQPLHQNLGNTVGLLLRILAPIFGYACVVILESGFCVLKGIVELKKRGVFASALIKKRRYWPKFIRGDDIKDHFNDKSVGDCDAWKGCMDEVDFHVYAMKEPDYVMSLMSTYGTNQRTGKTTRRDWVESGTKQQKSFQYPEVVGNHFLYRHSVDDHNNKRHSPISIEETWGTKWWPNRVFAFLLAVTEVNVNLGLQYFSNYEKLGQIEFRKQLAGQLIFNDYFQEEEDMTPDLKRRRSREQGHTLTTLPKGKKFSGVRIVKAASDYPQHKCSGCDKRVRTYCSCTPGVYRCSECFGYHLSSRENNLSTPS